MKNPLFTSKIEESIIYLLSQSVYRTTDLLEKIQAKHSISKQAFYDTLRRLKKAQILLINQKIVSLNKLWVESLIQLTQNIAHTYDEEYRMESKYLNLQPGERVTYTFNSIEEADIFWNHAVLLLVQNHDLTKPICVYNPHQWFVMARPETERQTYTSLAEKGALLFCLITGKTQLDIETLRTMNGWHKRVQASLAEKEILPNSRYVNIYGNIIIEVKFPAGVVEDIDRWFAKGDGGEDAREGLEKIIQEGNNIKFTFSNNPARAKKLSKQIAKYFYFPKNYSL